MVVVRVAERRAHQEAVELRLGQAVRALLLDRVLGGEDDERTGHVVAGAVDGDVALLHHLEQGGLRLRRCPVDLVGEDDVGEHRAAAEVEAALGLVVDETAGDVGGQQVRRELDAAPGALDGMGDRLGQRRLARAGHIVEEQVALAEHAHERQGDLVALALDHLLDVVEQGVEPMAEPLGLLVGRWGHGGVS